MEQDRSVSRQITRLMEVRGMGRVRLAVLSGIPYDGLCQALRGQRPFYTDELPLLARALRVQVEDLLKDDEEVMGCTERSWGT